MIVTIKRYERPDKTPGEVLVDGEYFAFSLEDKVRSDGSYQYGETAIPYGRYRLIISFSNRFQKRMIQVINVRGGNIQFGGRSIDQCGIRIHGGNTTEDTLGCILIGAKRTPDENVFECADVVSRLTSMVDTADHTGEVYLDVIKG